MPESLPYISHGYVHEHNFSLQLSHSIDTRSNTADRMFNTVTEAWDYTCSWQPRNTYAQLMVMFKDILERYWKHTASFIGYWPVDYTTGSNDMTGAVCAPTAKRGFLATSLYDTHVICIISPLTNDNNTRLYFII